MASVFRKWWFWALSALLLIVVALTFLASTGDGRAEVSTEQFTRDVQAGRVLEVEVDGSEIT